MEKSKELPDATIRRITNDNGVYFVLELDDGKLKQYDLPAIKHITDTAPDGDTNLINYVKGKTHGTIAVKIESSKTSPHWETWSQDRFEAFIKTQTTSLKVSLEPIDLEKDALLKRVEQLEAQSAQQSHILLQDKKQIRHVGEFLRGVEHGTPR